MNLYVPLYPKQHENEKLQMTVITVREAFDIVLVLVPQCLWGPLGLARLCIGGVSILCERCLCFAMLSFAKN